VSAKFKAVLVILSLLLFIGTATSWWNQSWEYRKQINITEQTGQTLNDYQIEFKINTSELISEGKLQTDCSEIRFANSENQELDYWIEKGCNTTSTELWVEINSISASENKKIYIYYGNSEADSSSNGSKTFKFFDSFEDGTLSDSWKLDNSGAQTTEEDGHLKIGGDGNDARGGAYTEQTFSSGTAIESLSNVNHKNTGYARDYPIGFDDPASGLGNGQRIQEASSSGGENDQNGYFYSVDSSGSTQSGFGFIDERNTTRKLFWYENKAVLNFSQTKIASVNSNIPNKELSAAVGTEGQAPSDAVKVYWIAVRNFTTPEPSYEIGSEEKASLCDERGPKNECIVDSENEISGWNFKVDSELIFRTNSIMRAESEKSILEVSNTSSISGLWTGTFNFISEDITLRSGSKLRPDKRIILNETG
jgi:hypothetical protein